MKRFYFCGIVFLWIFLPLLSKASETITWYTTNISPLFIDEDQHQQRGYLYLIQKEIVNVLPTYHHLYKEGNFARIIKEIKTNDHVCSVSLLKTPEREQFIAFSIAHSLILANSLIVKKDRVEKLLPYLNHNNAVDLDALLSSGNFVLGLAKGRKYGTELETILKKYRYSSTIYQRASTEQSEGLIRMLLLGRRNIEGILGYPEEVQYVLKQANIDDAQLVSYPIQGTPAYLLGYVGCSKGKLGQAVIRQIETVIRKHRANEFSVFHQQWLPQASKETYHKLLKQAFIDEPQ